MGGVVVWLYLFLTPSRDGGGWTGSHSGRFTAGGTASDSTGRSIGGRQNSSQRSKERKLSCPWRDSNWLLKLLACTQTEPSRLQLVSVVSIARETNSLGYLRPYWLAGISYVSQNYNSRMLRLSCLARKMYPELAHVRLLGDHFLRVLDHLHAPTLLRLKQHHYIPHWPSPNIQWSRKNFSRPQFFSMSSPAEQK